jgi:uncharacterized protein YggL (DUF469 family)
MSYDGLDLSILHEILPSNKLLKEGSACHINPVLLSFVDIGALDESGQSSFSGFAAIRNVTSCTLRQNWVSKITSAPTLI